MKSNEYLFSAAGKALAASQIFEVVFVLAANLAVKQAGVEILENIKPIPQSKAFKQPTKALLQELSKAQSIPAELEGRISMLADSRHRIVHRAFTEFGWPATMSDDKESEFIAVCELVVVESNELSILLVDIFLAWLKKFPGTSGLAVRHEQKFKELADLVRSQFGTENA